MTCIVISQKALAAELARTANWKAVWEVVEAVRRLAVRISPLKPLKTYISSTIEIAVRIIFYLVGFIMKAFWSGPNSVYDSRSPSGSVALTVPTSKP